MTDQTAWFGWHAFGTTRRVPTSVRPDLFVFMDAYQTLGVEYSADSSAIRHAHRRLAKQHHPDKHPAGSAEQQQASARMAEINDAYGLVRDAPLRYHRISRASDPTTPWTDSELDTALQRARVNQQFDRWMTVGLMAVAVILLPLLSSSFIMVKATSPLGVPLMLVMSVGMSMVSMLIIWTMLGPDAWRILFTVESALVVWQMLRGYF